MGLHSNQGEAKKERKAAMIKDRKKNKKRKDKTELSLPQESRVDINGRKAKK